METNKTLFMLPDQFFGLTPPLMLIAGGILILLWVLRVISIWGDKRLTQIIGVAGIVSLMGGVCWLLLGSPTSPEHLPYPSEKQEQAPLPAKSNPEKVPGASRSMPVSVESDQVPVINHGGRFVDPTGGGIPNAEVLINKHPVGLTDAYGDFRVALPSKLYGEGAAVLECRKLSPQGALSGQTVIDPGYSNENLRIRL